MNQVHPKTVTIAGAGWFASRVLARTLLLRAVGPNTGCPNLAVPEGWASPADRQDRTRARRPTPHPRHDLLASPDHPAKRLPNPTTRELTPPAARSVQ
jgi:hypothetical protein